MAQRYYAGFDIGGTRIKAIAVTPEGQRVAEAFAPTRDGDFEDGVPAYAWEAREILRRWESELDSPADGVGIAAPGVAAKDDSRMIFMVGRMQDVVNFDFARFFATPKMVPVLNDAHAALLGEAWIGVAAGMVDIALLTLGTGVGGAMMLDGQLVKGAYGRAGHFGHSCIDIDGRPGIFGTPGVLEDFIGNFRVAERSGGRFTDTRSLVDAAAAGDAEANALWNRTIRALACGIATIANILDPEAIIVGGGIAEAGPILWERLDAELDIVEWRPNGHRVKIIRPALGDWAGAYGAARRAIR